jgi:hypothetical protein
VLLRRNPEAVLVAGPRFPDSNGRIADGANGGPLVNPVSAARAAAAVGLTANEAVSGGVGASRPRRGAPPATVEDGRSYPRVSDLALAVTRGYLTVSGTSRSEAEESQRQHSRISMRAARSRSLEQAASPGRESARPPRSFSG